MPVKVRCFFGIVAKHAPDQGIAARELHVLRHEYRMKLKWVDQRTRPVPLKVVLDENEMIGWRMKDDLSRGRRVIQDSASGGHLQVAHGVQLLPRPFDWKREVLNPLSIHQEAKRYVKL
ncbi:MAG: hypothetical protein ACRYFU_03200 [Janthinobacterium lividum]